MDENKGAATTAAQIIERKVRSVEKLTFASREDREAYIKSLPNKNRLQIARFNYRTTSGKMWQVYIATPWA